MRNKQFLLEVLALVEGERAEKYGDVVRPS